MKQLALISFNSISCIILFVASVGASVGFAQEDEIRGPDSLTTEIRPNPLMTPEELQIQQRARKRLYQGGADEEPLKVQSQLPQAPRRMGPTTEVPYEESAE